MLFFNDQFLAILKQNCFFPALFQFLGTLSVFIFREGWSFFGGEGFAIGGGDFRVCDGGEEGIMVGNDIDSDVVVFVEAGVVVQDLCLREDTSLKRLEYSFSAMVIFSRDSMPFSILIIISITYFITTLLYSVNLIPKAVNLLFLFN